MQALQSSTAWKSEDRSGQFRALRHVTRTMGLASDETPVAEVALAIANDVAGSAGGVAEGAGLAHDVGNLLGALTLYSDLLALPGVLREEHRAYAAELRLLSERSRAMVSRLVHHARMEQAAGAEAGTVLPKVIEHCRGLLSKVAGRTVEVIYGAGAFERVDVPAESVERILTNLVKNAAEAAPWVGAIAVSVEGAVSGDSRRRVVLTVRDQGCGMDRAAMRRLMQAGGIVPANGRGLGFRVVRELVAISGGCLSIESQVDVGTSVSAEWYAKDDFKQAQTVQEARSRAC